MVAAISVMLTASACFPLVDSDAPPYRPPEGAAEWSELELVRDDGSHAYAADPFVLRVGDRWYLYPTSNTSGFEAWSSEDLVAWRYEGFVWRPTPGTWNDHGNYWAPFVERDDDGSYLLYYTASQHIGVARASSPAGPFVDLIGHPLVGGGYGGVGDGRSFTTGNRWVDLVLTSDESAIDAHVLRASDGSRTLYFSYSPRTGPSTVGALRLVDDAEVAPGFPARVLSIELVSWEGIVREGPVVEERPDGRFVLTYSGSPYVNTCYAVGQAVADDPMGPFLRTRPGPFLHDDPAIGLYGPGHHSFTTAPDGTRVIFFHTQTTLDRDVGRNVRWARIDEDGHGNIELVDPPGKVGSGRSSCWPFPL